ncbi:tRNA (adenosine(37)-N6)-threonylcarbamoyltransferase complex ATPase subunit type 1 TsaE [Myxococcota bacterium]|nr:tRNA (adenosine(37)-N6)-threonylcarbamoyltransferase complex ATPase subunit type 1 TsaE [Myxococcota bacterium]
MLNAVQLELLGLEDTQRLGRLLGQSAEDGDLLALDGPLGAGKTSLTQGLAAGLGVPGRVLSPTFAMVMLHEGGRLPLVHADLYRVGDPSELDELGWDEHVVGGGVVAVEWAGRFPEALPEDHLAVRLDGLGDSRSVSLAPRGPRAARWAAAVLKGWRAGE